MGMRHGLLRTSCSRNPKNTSNPLIFCEKMAAFRCFVDEIEKACKHAKTACLQAKHSPALNNTKLEKSQSSLGLPHLNIGTA